MPALQPAEILYVFDAYCGWCWGFSSIIGSLAENYADRFRFSALSGGLITGERIGPLGNFGAYIEKAIPRVAQTTGAVFSDAYIARIRQPSTHQDSRVPASVFAAVIAAQPAIDSIALAHDILALQFSAGRDLSCYEEYAGLLRACGLDSTPTLQALRGGAYLSAAEQQFTFARDLGTEAFPAIVYGRNGQYYPLCQGYQDYEYLSHALEVLYRDPPEL